MNVAPHTLERLIARAIRSKRLSGPPSEERVRELVEVLPHAVRCAVVITVVGLFPIVIGTLMYFGTLFAVGALFGGWTHANRWRASLVLLVMIGLGYLVYLLLCRSASFFLASYISRQQRGLVETRFGWIVGVFLLGAAATISLWACSPRPEGYLHRDVAFIVQGSDGQELSDKPTGTTLGHLTLELEVQQSGWLATSRETTSAQILSSPGAQDVSKSVTEALPAFFADTSRAVGMRYGMGRLTRDDVSELTAAAPARRERRFIGGVLLNVSWGAAIAITGISAIILTAQGCVYSYARHLRISAKRCVCPYCGYSMRGIDGHVCPECGRTPGRA